MRKKIFYTNMEDIMNKELPYKLEEVLGRRMSGRLEYYLDEQGYVIIKKSELVALQKSISDWTCSHCQEME